ncbi:hypothetical protein IMF23_04595 [Chelatococcus daeguensis]|nr:hypothetical protein [Chelatococcus daeguensis]
MGLRPNLISIVRSGSTQSGQVVNFEALCASPEHSLQVISPHGIQVGISCLGTTRKAAGSRTGLFRVDHDYVLAVAKGVRARGARQFILVTAAWAGGPGFYLKTKGKIEHSVTALGFERLDIIRPGLLIGERNSPRAGEEIGQRVSALLAPLLFGPLARFGAVSVQTVANAIVGLAGEIVPGRFVHENDEIRRLGAG